VKRNLSNKVKERKGKGKNLKRTALGDRFLWNSLFSLPGPAILLEGSMNDAVVTQQTGKGERRKLLSPVKDSRFSMAHLFSREGRGRVFRSLKILHGLSSVAYGQILPKSILKFPKYGLSMSMPSLFQNIGSAPCLASSKERSDRSDDMVMDEGMDKGISFYRLRFQWR